MPGIAQPKTTPQETSTIVDGTSIKNGIIDFIIDHGFSLLILLILVLILCYGINKWHDRQNQIQKLWLFTLFFLTKRQMLIPLVITLSKKDALLSDEIQKKLLTIRDTCRGVSFKKHPAQRLKIEQEVSEILYFYFQSLEKKNQIHPGTKFAKIVSDLEFIDAKLIQLQAAYNQEVEQWNRLTHMPLMSVFWKLARLKTFEKFES